MALEQISIRNLPVLADANVVSGRSRITGITQDIQLENVLSYTRTAYAAGTARIVTEEFTGFTIVDGQKWSFQITHNGVTKDYPVYVANSATYTIIAQAIRTRINADPDRCVDVTGGGATLTLTQIAATVADGTFTVDTITGVVEVTTQAYVAPQGTEAVVNALGLGTAAAGCNYTTYDITYNLFYRSEKVGGSKIAREVSVKVFAEETAVDYALFNAAMINIFTNTTQDIVKRVSGIASSVTSHTVTGTLTALDSTNIVDCTAGSIVLTLPDSVTLGEQVLLFRRIDNAGGNTLTLQRAGTDTVDGGASITISPDRACLLVNIPGSADYWSMPLDETPSSAVVDLTDGTGLAGSHDDTIANIVYNNALTNNAAGAAADQVIETIAAETLTAVAAANIDLLVDSTTGAADDTVSPIAGLTAVNPGALTLTIVSAPNVAALTNSTSGAANNDLAACAALTATTIVGADAIAGTGADGTSPSGAQWATGVTLMNELKADFNALHADWTAARGVIHDNFTEIAEEMAVQRTLNAEIIAEVAAALADITDIRTQVIALITDWTAARTVIQNNNKEFVDQHITQRTLNTEIIAEVAAALTDSQAKRVVINNNSMEWANELGIIRTAMGVIEQDISDVTQKVKEIVAVI